jgi:hypothetical protein
MAEEEEDTPYRVATSYDDADSAVADHDTAEGQYHHQAEGIPQQRRVTALHGEAGVLFGGRPWRPGGRGGMAGRARPSHSPRTWTRDGACRLVVGWAEVLVSGLGSRPG